jgi:putative acetyltransferase
MGFEPCADSETCTHVANLAAAAAAVELRPYRPEDEAAVVALWWSSWHSIRQGLRHPQPLADWRTRWATEIVTRQAIVVAEDDGGVVGFAAADLSAGVLTQIFVAPDRTRDGIGRRLLAWAQRSMPAGFRLRTLADNVGSRAFYERHGLTAGDTQINPVNGLTTIEYRWTPA